MSDVPCQLVIQIAPSNLFQMNMMFRLETKDLLLLRILMLLRLSLIERMGLLEDNYASTYLIDYFDLVCR